VEGGFQIELFARHSRQAITQIFVGIYEANGLPLAEEYYAHCPDESIAQALEWGEKRGCFLIERARNQRPIRIWPRTMNHPSDNAARSLDEKSWSSPPIP
jgi:hypothetical protein